MIKETKQQIISDNKLHEGDTGFSRSTNCDSYRPYQRAYRASEGA